VSGNDAQIVAVRALDHSPLDEIHHDLELIEGREGGVMRVLRLGGKRVGGKGCKVHLFNKKIYEMPLDG
jgi:hypothetical protein